MKSLSVSTSLSLMFKVFMLIGLVSLGFAFMTDTNRAWHGYILNYYFFMSIGLGGIFFTATQHITNAGWSSTVRRIPEMFLAWFGPSVVLFIPILIGIGVSAPWGARSVYQWTNPELVAKDHLLHMKTGYLNLPFFLIRAALFFAVWYFIGGRMVRNSLKQDETGAIEITRENVKLAAIFIPLFAILFSAISYDLVMSLDPHWYSTMFGVNCFANLFLSALATINIVVIHMKKKGYFGDSVNENHIQNLGLLMFAFVIFYAYITFCQFMLIWYGNLPEETSYYIRRWEHGWSAVALGIVFFKFAVPFLLLLPREAKRNMNYLLKMAYLVFAACWLDAFWMVMPNYSEKPFLPIFEIGIFFGFAGAFGWMITSCLSHVPIQPQKDPRVHEALHLHQ